MDRLMKLLISKFGNKKKTARLSPEARSRAAFEKQANEQFKRLKEKGLSISVFSL